MPAGITGYELKRYSVKISNNAHPPTDGNNIHSISSKIYVLNFNILKILARKGNSYSGLSKNKAICFMGDAFKLVTHVTQHV